MWSITNHAAGGATDSMTAKEGRFIALNNRYRNH